MPIKLSDLPLESMPTDMSRGLSFNDPAILNYADKVNEQAGLPKGLLRSTIQNGEKSNPLSQNPRSKARGVGQFTPDTAARYGLKDPTDPKASIEAMALYYKDAVKATKSLDPKILAAAYNAGMNKKELQRGKIPNIPETRAYVQRVSAEVAPAPKGITMAQINAQRDKDLQHVSPLVENVKPETSAAKAFGKSVLESTLPSLAGLAAFGPGFEAGAFVGAPLAPLTAGVGPIVTGIIGGLGTSLGGSWITGKAQEMAAKLVPDTVAKWIGMDAQQRAAETSDHPYASFIGSMAPNLLTMKPGVSNIGMAVSMAGINSGTEAVNELRKDGSLDPWKIGIAATIGGLVNKPTKLGQSIIDATSPHWTSLSKITPKDKYVEEVTKKGGDKAAAEQLWDNTDKATHPPAGAIALQGQSLSEIVKFLDDSQHSLKNQRVVDKLKIADWLKSMKPEEYKAASSEAVYHAQPEEANYQPPAGPGQPPRLGKTKPPLTPEEQYAHDRYVEPLRQKGAALYAKIKALGDPDAAAYFDPQGHNVRIQQSNWLNRLASISENLMGNSSMGRFAATPGSAMPRSMFAIQFEDGTRKVVHVDGRELAIYNNKKAGPPINFAKSPQVGQAINVQGRKAWLTQATTKEIEAETNFKYNKNALANNLWMNAQMESYLREHDFLTNTIKGLERTKWAIPKSEVRAVPRGYSGLDGGPAVFRNYWLRDEIAYTLKDGLLKDPEHAISSLNGFMVGSMFWNPTGHLLNGFDHYLTTVMGGVLKPWRWGTLAKSMVEAYHDVKTLGPDYQAYLANGMGLNYGRVAVDSIYEGMLKGIDHQNWGRIAAEWGMKPQDLINGLYATSRHALWAGSDMMMISAHKYMASVKGKSIFDQAIRQHMETHNPNYRIPPQIGYNAFMAIPGMPEAAAKSISRNLSLIMQSRAFNVFGRYHFGQFKSAGHDIHDFIFQNEHSSQTRGEALAHMSAVAFNLLVVYPFIWDTIAKVVSGDPTAEQRRAGASTIPYTVWHMVLGDKSVNDLMRNAWSLPPAPKMVGETLFNRNLFTGQHIWEPGDNALGKATDYGKYVAGNIFQPLQVIQDPSKQLPQSVGIQTKMDVREAKTAKRLKMEKAAARRHQKKRGYLED